VPTPSDTETQQADEEHRTEGHPCRASVTTLAAPGSTDSPPSTAGPARTADPTATTAPAGIRTAIDRAAVASSRSVGHRLATAAFAHAAAVPAHSVAASIPPPAPVASRPCLVHTAVGRRPAVS
jgi:hypothetical protein